MVPALAAAGIESILLKGPTFARWLYPEGGRLYGDVDLIVAPGDVLAAQKVLAARGFVDQKRGFREAEMDLRSSTFVRTGRTGRDLVDLHWNFDGAPQPEVTWRELGRHTEELEVGGVRVTGLDDPARALHVALHAAHHGLGGPDPAGRTGKTGEDLARALTSSGAEIWEQAATLSRDIGLEAAFAFGLRLHPEGAGLADRLGLSRELPDLWKFPGTTLGRGVAGFYRLLTAPGLGPKTQTLARTLVPSPSRVRMGAGTRLGRSSLPWAYLEYWFDSARAARSALGPAVAHLRQRRGPVQ